ncbi:MAG: ABC transporter ATP-binding protein/permease [Gammaproteobacteria bacterium]|nr:ABC transporter ATP-binding protein/permease [Gammaproteobacteria bacterium]
MLNKEKFNTQCYKNFWHLCKPFWISEDKWAARKLLILNIACILTEIHASIWLNNFNKNFFDALQNFDKQAIIRMLPSYSFYLMLLVLSFGYGVYFAGLLSLRWRTWLTKNYLSTWLSQHNHYRMQLSHNTLDNPDQRISEDLEKFPTLTLTLSFSILHSVITLISFSTILWNLSGTLVIPFHSFHIVIPGYLCWAALLYAMVGTWLMNIIGKKLAPLDYLKEQRNADFRFSLVRFREASEQIALHDGTCSEEHNFSRLFQNISANFLSILKIQKHIKIFNNTYKTISYVFGLLISMPSYFAKKILLGTVIQISGAFSTVISAVSVLIDSFGSLAEWQAVIFRLTEFNHALNKNKILPSAIQISTHAHTTILIQNLNLTLPNNQTLFKNLNFTFHQGEKTLMQGPSGLGKSTLFHALAGTWHYGNGKIIYPAYAKKIFLPQKPYLPLGTLREIILYPIEIKISDHAIVSAMKLCGLEKFISQLDKIDNWSHVLSLGEQQLIAFTKIFLMRPDIIFLDESTSSLDEQAEHRLLNTLLNQLPRATVISICHRNSVKKLYDNVINLENSNEKQGVNSSVTEVF